MDRVIFRLECNKHPLEFTNQRKERLCTGMFQTHCLCTLNTVTGRQPGTRQRAQPDLNCGIFPKSFQLAEKMLSCLRAEGYVSKSHHNDKKTPNQTAHGIG